MFFLTERRVRELIREELQSFSKETPQNIDLYNQETGAEVILPNYVKERFDSNQVQSIGDIL